MSNEIDKPQSARCQADEAHSDLPELEKSATAVIDWTALTPMLTEIVDAAVTVAEVDLANIQLIDVETSDLKIVAQRGFPQWWLDISARVKARSAPCRAALERRARIIIEDVEQDPIFAETPDLAIMRRAGIRAVQSTPIISRSGERLGVFSTHYREPRWPPERALRLLDLLAQQAADIIDSAKANLALREAEFRNRMLIDATNTVTWSFPPTECLEVQQSWMTFTGQSADEILGEGWADAVHPDDRARVTQSWSDAARQGANFRSLHRIRRHDGQWRWMDVHAVPFRGPDGKILHWIGMNVDVSDRKVAEDQAASASEELRRTLDIAATGLTHLSLDKRYLWVNAAYAKWIGLPEGQIVDRPMVDVLGQAAYDVIRPYVERVLRGESVKYEADLPINGSLKPIQVVYSPERDATGRVVGWVACVTDISELKQINAALRESEAKLLDLNATLEQRASERTKQLLQSEDLYRRTLQALPAHIAVIDRDGKILAVNHAWEEFAARNGADGEASLAVGADYLAACRGPSFGNDETAAKALAGIESVMAGRTSRFTMDYPCHSPTEQRWFTMTVMPLGACSQSGAVITHFNITERIKAEQALAESQRLMTEAASGAHFGSWSWDIATGEVHWSAELYKLYGLDAEKYVPSLHSFRQLVHPDDAERIERLILEISSSGKTFEFDFRIVAADGSTRTLWTKGTAIGFDSEGKPRLMSGINLDITERKQAEARLAESEERLRMATEAGHVGIFTIDPRSGAVLYSRELASMLGSGESKNTQFEDVILRVHRDDQSRFRRLYEVALKADSDGQLDMEFRFVPPGGEARWMALNGRVCFEARSGGREPVQVFGTCIDITERKHFEEKLAEANTALEARVAERTEQLKHEMKLREQTQAELTQSQRLEALGQLTGGIAHDFNNLLTIVSGNLELAETRISDEQAHFAVRKAIEAVETGAAINRRLLAFARRGRLAPQKLVLNERMSEMQRLLRRTLGEQITLATKLDAGLWPTLADPGEIDSTIINLAINARDAMPNGGTLTLATHNLSLDEDAARAAEAQPGDYVCLTLTDTGHGMTPDVLKRAIEPFFTTKEAGKGTGLGLSSVYGFARQSGGFIDISSEVGKGTSVQVCLPRANAQSEGATQTSGASKVPAGQGELILVIEDNDDVRQVTLKRLEALGYDVLEARSGTEAIALLKSPAPIALVFSDVVMSGGMSGYDVARWIRAKKPGLKVLLTSGNEERALRDKLDMSSETSGLKVLAKPYSRAQLGQAIHDALITDTISGGEPRP